MRRQPLVSIIIPVYNGSNYLREAIDSALAQTYPNIEIIVVNDGSNDKGKTDKIARSYGDQIRYFKKENGGVSSALNFGISKMRGEYFSWLSHDDVYLPEKVEAEIDVISNHDQPSIVFSNFYLIDEDGTIVAETHFENQFDRHLLMQNIYPAIRGCVNGDTVLIHREIVQKYGAFDETLETSGDSDLWLRIFPHYPHHFIEKSLIKYRVHPNQDTQKHPKYKSQSDDIALKKIRTISKTHTKQWECTLFKIYMDLFKQFNDAQLPQSSKLAYALGKKHFSNDIPTFSIIAPEITNTTIDNILNSNLTDYEVLYTSNSKTVEDFRFTKLSQKIKSNKKNSIQTVTNNSRGKHILVLSPGSDIQSDLLFEEYKRLKQTPQQPKIIYINDPSQNKNSIIVATLMKTTKRLISQSLKNGGRIAKKNIRKIPNKLKATLKKSLNTKNTIFFSSATNDYIAKSAASLLSIRQYLPKAKLCIISRNISLSNQRMLRQNNIEFIDTDLRGHFNRHWQYPAECFYIFAGPELFLKQGYKYSVYIDGDILCCSNPLKSITKITGIAGVAVGNCRGVFTNDFEALKSIFNLNEEQINRMRIASGIVYFNNKKMNEIQLLDKATRLFKKCLDEKAPRKGDDSLFTLIQLLYFSTDDIKKLDYAYNYMPTLFGKQLPKKIVFLHFAEYKPWNDYSQESDNIKQYIVNWLKFYSPLKQTEAKNRKIYQINNSTSLYSEKKYRANQNKTPLNIFISEDINLGILNFGDELPKDLIPAIFGYQIKATSNINETDLLSVGSVLFALTNLKPHKKISCWGSGFISSEPIKNEKQLLKQVSFSAVRGTYTLKRINRKNIPLGDPGILANIIYPASQTKKHKIGIVPHYIDADNPIVEKLRHDKRFFIINPLDPPAKVAQEISSCKYILSSSLHGLIFADSYGIPNAHVNFSDKVYGGEYKFRDYDSAFNKNHLDLDIDKIFDIQYIENFLQNYKPIKNLKKYQQNLIDSFPY